MSVEEKALAEKAAAEKAAAEKALAVATILAAGLGITDASGVNADHDTERSKADRGEIVKACAVNVSAALTVRLHTPAARRAVRSHILAGYVPGMAVIKGASPVKTAEKVGIKRVAAIAAAARSLAEALAGLDSAGQEIVRALVLIEASGYAAGLVSAKGSMIESAPFAGELAKVR